MLAAPALAATAVSGPPIAAAVSGPSIAAPHSSAPFSMLHLMLLLLLLAIHSSFAPTAAAVTPAASLVSSVLVAAALLAAAARLLLLSSGASQPSSFAAQRLFLPLPLHMPYCYFYGAVSLAVACFSAALAPLLAPAVNVVSSFLFCGS